MSVDFSKKRMLTCGSDEIVKVEKDFFLKHEVFNNILFLETLFFHMYHFKLSIASTGFENLEQLHIQ